ncbi:PepSY domain-containing protein [Photobacterium sanguinicancri]|uniref:PepSY domain-containing protein n=1 Tax=Photobacterium sanguinicancri TaxID=875932 RepID=A0AAW7Y444_9GAMM|nr:PepSY domain-containing protein [Photobacterium sanguinicancri]MDO6542219.1 PepSY domain-containing protein [Photobacterium sanguinicancri]
MKLFIAASLLTLTLAIAPVTCIADPIHTAPSNALTVQKALRILQDQGYYDFRKIKLEQDDREIEVEARNKIGNKVEIELDLYTGQIMTIDHD